MSHPKRGSKKWRGAAKRFIVLTVDDLNSLLAAAGSNKRLVVKGPTGAKARRRAEA